MRLPESEIEIHRGVEGAEIRRVNITITPDVTVGPELFQVDPARTVVIAHTRRPGIHPTGIVTARARRRAGQVEIPEPVVTGVPGRQRLAMIAHFFTAPRQLALHLD